MTRLDGPGGVTRVLDLIDQARYADMYLNNEGIKRDRKEKREKRDRRREKKKKSNESKQEDLWGRSTLIPRMLTISALWALTGVCISFLLYLSF